MATLYAYSPNGTQATLPVNVMGFTQSLATNGWCKLPNDLIFQWLKTTRKENTNTNLSNYGSTWPIVFSTIYRAIGAAGPNYNNTYVGYVTDQGGADSTWWVSSVFDVIGIGK